MARQQQAGSPNILLIVTDQHAPRIAGFAGDRVVQTQNLDSLSARSVQFDAAICASPCCTPSRMCFLTGKEVHRCGGWNNHWVIFPEHVTWPEHFAAHGYRTCLVGKMHFGGRDQMQGFQCRPYGDLRHGLGHQPDPIDLFPAYAGPAGAGITEIPESLLQDVVVTRETISFLLEHQDVQPQVPWFCCASYSRPHSPFTAPGRYIRRYRDRVPPVAGSDHSENHSEPFVQKLRLSETYDQLTPEQTQKAREAYYACVDYVDDCIGELFNALEAGGLLENTIIIYTSDHGEMAGVHDLWGKGVYYESSIGVPLLVTGPGIQSGHHRLGQPVSLMDLFPTTCALAGLPVPAGLDGVDFSDVLADPSLASAARQFAPSSYYVYGVRSRGAPGAAEDEPCRAMRLVRGQNWKYVEIEHGDALLFDLLKDPLEQVNLANLPEHAERCQSMRTALYENFSWEQAHAQLAEDRERIKEFGSGMKPTTPNQYMLPDGRVFDAEGDLYGARWLFLPPAPGGGIIPQQFG